MPSPPACSPDPTRDGEGDQHPEEQAFYEICLRHIKEERGLTPRITRPPTSYPKHEITRVAGRVHALVRLRAIFSPSCATPRVKGVIQPAPCPAPPAPAEVRPGMMADAAGI